MGAEKGAGDEKGGVRGILTLIIVYGVKLFIFKTCDNIIYTVLFSN